MSLDNIHPLYPYTKEDVQEIRAALELKSSTIEEDVDAIVDWFQKQPHLVEAGIDRDIAERMLIIAKGSIERTKRRIDNIYKYRLLSPEIIQSREKDLSNSKDLWSAYFQVAMPKLYKGNRISIVKLIDPDPSNFSCEAFVRNTFMLGDIRMKYDYFLSDIWVIDLKDSTFSHLVRLNPALMHKAGNLFHDGLGLRINAIHIINAKNILQGILTFIKTFFIPKIAERVVVHDSLDELHKHVPKKYLPKDFGGEEPAMLEFKEMYEEELRSTRTKEYLLNVMTMVSNEKRRPNADINEEYLAGSFRKLEVD